MNIMLVSVTERTKEIGLRKAVGANRSDIMRQFLFEAVILTLVGGVFGILFGSVFSWVIAFGVRQFGGFDWSFSFPLMAAVIGWAVAAIVGLSFGIYPAYQAAKKDPVEALRYE